MFDNCSNTKKQGNVGLAAAMLYFTKLGAVVLIPLNDAQDYDLVVDIDGTLSRVQVKTTRQKAASGFYKVELRSKGGTAGITYATIATGSSNLLFIQCADGTAYCIPEENYKHISTQLTLNNQYDLFKVT